MFELGDNFAHNAKIKVVGIGGGGGNAIEHMMAEHIEGVEFICANTDAQALSKSSARTVLHLGEEKTKGLGAGANPTVGREAAEENRNNIRELLVGTDMVFITAGMGGGTGTGGAPIFAEIAKELGILTVAVVTKPFVFEGKKRMEVADEGIKALSKYVDSLITIPNNKLLSVLGKNISLLNAFKAANNVLFGAVKGIADLITRPGLINVDFADVRTVMSEMGMAMMGTGVATGENRAREAAAMAIASPLLEDIDFSGAKGVLVNITAGMDMSIGEFEAVGEAVKAFASESATVVVGTVIDPELMDELRVTVVVTGLGMNGRDTGGISSGALNRPVRNTTRFDGTPDYHQLERPTYLRNQDSSKPQTQSQLQPQPQSQPVQTPSRAQLVEDEREKEMEFLDIPAFLRKQEE